MSTGCLGATRIHGRAAWGVRAPSNAAARAAGPLHVGREAVRQLGPWPWLLPWRARQVDSACRLHLKAFDSCLTST